MSIKSKVLATAASLTMVGGVLAVSTLATATAAKAETPSCGAFNFFCVDLFSKQFGTHHDPGFIQDVYRQGNRVGQKIILFRVSSSDPAEDFTTNDLVCGVQPSSLPQPTTGVNPLSCTTFLPYTVAELQAESGNTLFAPITANQYANSYVVENEYAPFGVNSGLCTGIVATPFNGEGVTLQPCGITAKTLWIINSSNPIFTYIHGYTSLINGANANFSHPYVLTYPQEGYPTDLPRPQLQVHEVETFSQGFPFIVTQQLWGADFGTVVGT
jgi:hypothetical protein